MVFAKISGSSYPGKMPALVTAGIVWIKQKTTPAPCCMQ